jgi:hypothetical protein
LLHWLLCGWVQLLVELLTAYQLHRCAAAHQQRDLQECHTTHALLSLPAAAAAAIDVQQLLHPLRLLLMTEQSQGYLPNS